MQSYASKGYVDRVFRGLSQRICLLHQFQTMDNNYVYAVEGTTGNVYEVTLHSNAHHWSSALRCSCSDFQKRHTHCKHIAFVLYKVLRIEGQFTTANTRTIRQVVEQHFTTHGVGWFDLSQCLSKAAQFKRQYESNFVQIANDENSSQSFTTGIFAPNDERQRYYNISRIHHPQQNDVRATGSQMNVVEEIPTHSPQVPSDTPTTTIGRVNRKPYVGDCCAICMDEMGEHDSVVWCSESCGQSVHAYCFERWSGYKRNGKSTCVYCRNIIPLASAIPHQYRNVLLVAEVDGTNSYINVQQ